ncbi:M20 metallopeptidase family protein [Sedimentibacter sp. MB31-C6]|uniref:M20 metallopeptidase family protein n=1 Tax=Sedimentibacter sp. MB31-C6 TaxID=3109366 RepID=UPI002DDD0168|nr:M20 family metallopeptidase [Sedimentibacter sp. MB36-C1]WSI03444.1 M20 family metallopeptidase [Sedimentibacter sp. MB36-C1]
MDVKMRVNDIFDELVKIRRDFHKNPELGQKEFRTQSKIQEYLNDWGIENYVCADTGVVGIIRGKQKGITVGLRADIDALPINEKNNQSYCSINHGVMHACGHDAHATILLGIGKIIKEMEDSLKGNIKLFFQPAEESVGGGERMVQAGCMLNPKVDYVLGLHVMPYIDVGKVELKYGKLNASTDSVSIKLKGKSAHGAYPDLGTDAIIIAGHVITSLQTIVSRNISPLNSVVLSLGKITGGIKSNVIADEVMINGTLRALDNETRSYVKERISDIVVNTAKSFGGVGTVEFYDGYEALINNDEVVDVIKENAEKFLGSENIVYKEYPSLGAEDFSYFSDIAKGAFFHLGCGNAKKGITAPIHTNNFDIDEECLKVGVFLQVQNILSLLK